MKQPGCDLEKSRMDFLSSLETYQSATLEMNLALQRLNRHALVFHQDLRTVITHSENLLAPSRH